MALRQREPRTPVRIGVRLKDDAGWCDGQIVNISSRGVMVVCADPPKRGGYVEIRRGASVMIGRVAWARGDRFGAQVREKIDLAELVQPVTPGRKVRRPTGECQVRVRRKPTVAERAASSRRFARAFDFAATAALVLGLALFGSSMVAHTLSEPLDQVGQALAGEISQP